MTPPFKLVAPFTVNVVAVNLSTLQPVAFPTNSIELSVLPFGRKYNPAPLPANAPDALVIINPFLPLSRIICEESPMEITDVSPVAPTLISFLNVWISDHVLAVLSNGILLPLVPVSPLDRILKRETIKLLAGLFVVQAFAPILRSMTGPEI